MYFFEFDSPLGFITIVLGLVSPLIILQQVKCSPPLVGMKDFFHYKKILDGDHIGSIVKIRYPGYNPHPSPFELFLGDGDPPQSPVATS
jgi:hypothetical protein